MWNVYRIILVGTLLGRAAEGEVTLDPFPCRGNLEFIDHCIELLLSLVGQGWSVWEPIRGR